MVPLSTEMFTGVVSSATGAVNTAEVTTRVSTGQALATFKNELLLADDASIYSYDAGASQWNSKGAFQSVNVTKSQVVRNTTQQTQQDGATDLATGLQMYAWEDSANGLTYSVIDGTTGQVVVSAAVISANGVKPKVLVWGSKFLLLYYNIGDTLLYAATIPIALPTTTLAPVAITTAAADTTGLDPLKPNYDATILSPASGAPVLALAFNNATTTGTTLWAFSLNTLATVLHSATHILDLLN